MFVPEKTVGCFSRLPTGSFSGDVMHVNCVPRCRPVVRRRNMNELTSLFLYYGLSGLSGQCYSVSLTQSHKLPPGCEMENYNWILIFSCILQHLQNCNQPWSLRPFVTNLQNTEDHRSFPQQQKTNFVTKSILVPSFSKYQAFGTIGYRAAFYQFLSNLVFRMNAPALVLITGSIETGFKEYWSKSSSLNNETKRERSCQNNDHTKCWPSQGWLVTKIEKKGQNWGLNAKSLR